MKGLILLIIIVAAGIIGLSSALYVVDETEQVIILRFGEVQDIKRTPGLNIKAVSYTHLTLPTILLV